MKIDEFLWNRRIRPTNIFFPGNFPFPSHSLPWVNFYRGRFSWEFAYHSTCLWTTSTMICIGMFNTPEHWSGSGKRIGTEIVMGPELPRTFPAGSSGWGNEVPFPSQSRSLWLTLASVNPRLSNALFFRRCGPFGGSHKPRHCHENWEPQPVACPCLLI